MRTTKRKKMKSKKTKAKRMKTKIASLGRTKKNEGWVHIDLMGTVATSCVFFEIRRTPSNNVRR